MRPDSYTEYGKRMWCFRLKIGLRLCNYKKEAFSVCQHTEYYVMLAANIKQMSVPIKMPSNISALQDHYK
jgi:hypothetical protein